MSYNSVITTLNSLTGFSIPTSSYVFVTGSVPTGSIVYVMPPTPVSGTISTDGIYPGAVIKADHVLRIINALNGVNPNDIILSGSLTVTGSSTMKTSLDLPFVPDQDFLYVSGGHTVGTDIIDGGTF